MSTTQTPFPAAAPGAPREAETICLTVHGAPAPQGSKTPLGVRATSTGRLVGDFKESSDKLTPWRTAVANAATAFAFSLPPARRLALPLDGPLAASMIFTMGPRPRSRPVWWPAGLTWSREMMWRPAGAPDLSKLLRATEDALTGIVWRDDARVVEYRGLGKYFVGDPAPDVLAQPGVVIRIWKTGGDA